MFWLLSELYSNEPLSLDGKGIESIFRSWLVLGEVWSPFVMYSEDTARHLFKCLNHHCPEDSSAWLLGWFTVALKMFGWENLMVVSIQRPWVWLPASNHFVLHYSNFLYWNDDVSNFCRNGTSLQHFCIKVY